MVQICPTPLPIDLFAKMATPSPAPMQDLDAEIARYGDLLRQVGSWGKLIDLTCPMEGTMDQPTRDLFVFATERIRTYLLGTCEFIAHARMEKMDNATVRKMGAAFLRECHLLTHSVTLAHPRRMFYEATYAAESRHTFMDHRHLRFAYMREEEQGRQFEEARKMGLTDHRSIHPPSLGGLLQTYHSMMPKKALTPAEWFAHTVGTTPRLVGKIAPAVMAGTLFMEKVPDMPIQYEGYYAQLKKTWEELGAFWVAMPAQALSALALKAPLDAIGGVAKDELVHLAHFIERAPKTLGRLNLESTSDMLLMEIFTHHLAGPDSSLPAYVVPASDELHRLRPALRALASEGSDLSFPATADGARKYLVDLMGSHAGELAKSVLPELSTAAVTAIEKEAAEYATLFATNAIDADFGRMHWTPRIGGLGTRVSRYEHANLSVVQAPVCFYYRDVRSVLYDSNMVVYSTIERAQKARPDAVALAEALYEARDIAIAELSLLRHTHRDALLRIQRASLKSGRYLDGMAEERAMRRELSKALRSPAVMRYVRIYMADITASRAFERTRKFLHELPSTHYARALVEVALGRAPVAPAPSTAPLPKVDARRPIPRVARPTPGASVAQVAAKVFFKKGNGAAPILEQVEPLQEIATHWADMKKALGQYYLNCAPVPMPLFQLSPKNDADKAMLTAARTNLANATLPEANKEAQRQLFQAEVSVARTTNDRKFVLTQIASSTTAEVATVDEILQTVLQGGPKADKALLTIETMLHGKKVRQGNWAVPDTAALHMWLANLVTQLVPLHEHALIAETSYAIFLLTQLAQLRQGSSPVLNYERTIEVAWGNYCIAYHHLSLGMGNEGRYVTGPGSLLESVYKTPFRLVNHLTAGVFQPLPVDLADSDVAEFVADEIGVINSIVHYWVGDFVGGDAVVNSAIQWSTEAAFARLGKKMLGQYALKPDGKAYPVQNKPSEFATKNKNNAWVLNALGFEVSFSANAFYIKIPGLDVILFQGEHGETDGFSFKVPSAALGTEERELGTGKGQTPTHVFGPAVTPTPSVQLCNGSGAVLVNSTVTPGWGLVKCEKGTFFAEVQEGTGSLQKVDTESDLWSWNATGWMAVTQFARDHDEIVRWAASGLQYAQLVAHQWRGMRPISTNEQWKKVEGKFSEEAEENVRVLYIADTFAPSSLIATGEEWRIQKYLPVARSVASNYGSGKVKGAIVGSAASYIGTKLAENKYSFMGDQMVLLGVLGSIVTIIALMASTRFRRRGIPGLNWLTTLVGLGSMFMYFIGWMVGDAQTVFSMVAAPWNQNS